MVRFYDGCTGLKTGTTSKAGHCLAASAVRNDMELIAVVLAADTGDNRFSNARKLLDHGFANFSAVKIEVDPAMLSLVKVKNGVMPTVQVRVRNPLSVLVPRGKEEKIAQSVQLAETVPAPIAENDLLGSVTVTLEGAVLGEIPLEAEHAVPKMTFSVALGWLLTALVKR